MTTKEGVQALQIAIKAAQDQIEAIRKECKHENQFDGVWSWRPGSYADATICADCGGLIKIKNTQALPTVTTTDELTQEEIATLGEEREKQEKDYEEFQKEQI